MYLNFGMLDDEFTASQIKFNFINLPYMIIACNDVTLSECQIIAHEIAHENKKSDHMINETPESLFQSAVKHGCMTIRDSYNHKIM